MSAIPLGQTVHPFRIHEYGGQHTEAKGVTENTIQTGEQRHIHSGNLRLPAASTTSKTATHVPGAEHFSSYLIENLINQSLSKDRVQSPISDDKVLSPPQIRVTEAASGIHRLQHPTMSPAEAPTSPQGTATSIARKLRKAASFAGFGAQRSDQDVFQRAESEPLLPSDIKRPSTAVNVTPSALEKRASVLSTASETPSNLSHQWFQTPQERMGFNFQVKKQGAAPWEKRHRQPHKEQEQPDVTTHSMTVSGLKKGWLSFLNVKRRP